MTLVYDSIKFLVKLGLYDVILPFVLVFTLSYGILDKTRVLGDNKNLNSVVSFVFGLIMIAFIRSNQVFGIIITFTMLFIIGVIVFFVIVKFLHKEWEPKGWPLALGFLFIIIILIGIFVEKINWDKILKVLGPIIPVLVLFGLISFVLWFVLKNPAKKRKEILKKIKNDKKEEELSEELDEEKISEMSEEELAQLEEQLSIIEQTIPNIPEPKKSELLEKILRYKAGIVKRKRELGIT